MSMVSFLQGKVEPDSNGYMSGCSSKNDSKTEGATLAVCGL